MDPSQLRSGLESTEWMERVRLPAAERVLFTRQLQVLLASGVPIPQCLEVLATQAVRPDCTEVYFSLQRLILEGRYLSAALGRFPNIFDAMYVGLIRVGEQSGTLVECVRLLADWLEREREVRQKLQSALIYPCLVLVVSVLSSLGLMNFLGPIFLQIFVDRQQALPWPTQVVASAVELQRQPWFWLVLFCLLVMFWRAAQSWVLNPHWRVWWWVQAARVPGLGGLLSAAAWSRYCVALSILLRCGLPPQRSYRFAAEVSGDPRLIVDSDRLVQSILEGGTASSHMESKSQLYPGLVGSALKLSEETGQGRPVLDFLARFYREEMEMRLQMLQSLIEPFLLLFTASTLTFLILSLMLPLYGQLQEVGL